MRRLVRFRAAARSFLMALAVATAVPAAVADDLPGGRFLLMDQYGRALTDQDFHGLFVLVYFGYTYCPDICPTQLSVMAEALDRLGDDAKRVQPLFITVDPDRDTPKVLGEYVTHFHPDLLGLGGSAELVARAAAAYKVTYEKVMEPGRDPAAYIIDHTASVFLIGPDGGFVTKFVHGVTAEQMAAGIGDALDSVKP